MIRHQLNFQGYSMIKPGKKKNSLGQIRFVIALFILYFSGITVVYGQKQKIGAFFNTLYEQKQFNGSVVVEEKGKVLFHGYLGQSNAGKNGKISSRSQFPIASVSKTFTAIAILQLKSKGLLQLDVPVKKYLPDFPYENITTRHLLSNTSGLTQYYTLFDQEIDSNEKILITNRDIIPVLNKKKVSLVFTPGERWEYNNLNFCLAALIVEKLSGKTFRDYLNTFIFSPSEMNNTFVPVNRKIKSSDQVELYSYANLYSTRMKNVDSLPQLFKIDRHSNFYGNGGIVSTANDLIKFNRALQNGKLLPGKEQIEAFSPTILNNGKAVSYKLDGKEVTYGLGWEMYTDTTHGKIVFHDGSILGLTSILMYNLSAKQAIVVLDNTGSNTVFAIANAIIELLGNRTYVIPGKNLPREYASAVVQGDTAKANDLINSYQSNPTSFRTSERDFIRAGYDLLRNNLLTESLKIFDTTVKLYPDSWNAYDSFGEALLKAGDKIKAQEMYQKSLKLNPENKNAAVILQELQKK